MSETKTLAAALCLAQATAQAVAKDSKNKFHGYKYASAESVIEEARGALSAAGLALLTVGWIFAPGGELDKSGLIGRVIVRYRLLHGTSPETLEFEASTPVLVDKGRPEDKAEMAALTLNLSYFLRGLLLLTRTDEGAIDARDDRGHATTVDRVETAVLLAPTVDAAESAAFRAIADEYLRKILDARDAATLGAIPSQVRASALPPPLHLEIVAAYNRARRALAPVAP